MLRISVLNDPEMTRLKLEGKLAHEWVEEAEKAWTALVRMAGSTELVVDLLLDEEAGAGAAALALVEEQGKVGALNRLVHVRIGEYDLR